MNSDQQKLTGKKIAILVAEGFDKVQLIQPRQALEQDGAQTVLIAPRRQPLRAWSGGQWSDTFEVDAALDQTKPDEFQALLLPGGVLGADSLRSEPGAVSFVKHFFAAGNPVAAISHGGWILIDANVLKGRSLTSAPSIKADLANAGAMWFDKEVVVNDGLITCRGSQDLQEFNLRMVEEFAEGFQKLQIAPSTLRPPSPFSGD
jgi:protease I